MKLAVRIFLRRRMSVTSHSRRLHASQSLRAFQSALSNCHNTQNYEGEPSAYVKYLYGQRGRRYKLYGIYPATIINIIPMAPHPTSTHLSNAEDDQ